MKEVGFKEYHDHLGGNKYLVLRWYVKHFSFTSLNSFLVVVTITTQKQGFLTKVILKFIALQLMSYYNSINSSETPITLIYFI
jgi:hypothetical protein